MFLKLGCVGLTFWLIAEGFSEMKRAWLVVIFLAMGGFVACKDSVQDSVWQKKFAELSESHTTIQAEYNALKKRNRNLERKTQEKEERLGQCYRFEDAIREYRQKIDSKSCKDLASCRKIFEIEMAYLRHENGSFLEVLNDFKKDQKLMRQFLLECENPPKTVKCKEFLEFRLSGIIHDDSEP